MPRVCDSGNEPHDFCRHCMPNESKAAEEFDNPNTQGPDGRGNCYEYEPEHPPYRYCDYNCERCGRKLNSKDD